MSLLVLLLLLLEEDLVVALISCCRWNTGRVPLRCLLQIDCLPCILGCLTNAWCAVGSLGGPCVLVGAVESDLVLVETKLQIQVYLLGIARLV